MTVDELSRVARILSDRAWCRYWVNWGASPPPAPKTVCLSARNADGSDYEIPPDQMPGFTPRRIAGRIYWFADRTD